MCNLLYFNAFQILYAVMKKNVKEYTKDKKILAQKGSVVRTVR